ncbi:esterase [Fusarium heterosporum]|uniref:Esterase n=1 Tax=Fusarium heterosporum TaxID=42747 RepID=A0A8H5TLQ2_FUSHE|nr:esterase [Fusarium heterosporum]
MPRKTFRVLCFGDSLTSGFFNDGLGSHPYAIKLRDRLTGTFPEVNFDIDVNGVPGDIVSSDRFYKRMNTAWRRKSYDWTIILGAYDFPAEEIFKDLRKVYDFVLSREHKVLALTIPERHSKREKSTRARNEINKCILKNKDTGYHAFDLCSKIPYHSLSEEDRERYWDDGLHLQAEGYDWMGNHIADALIDILWSEGVFEQSTTKDSDATGDEDGFFFDEEEGNPRKINEGYVVVRKKDLD